MSFSIYIDPFKVEFGSCIKIEVGLVREEFLDKAHVEEALDFVFKVREGSLDKTHVEEALGFVFKVREGSLDKAHVE